VAEKTAKELNADGVRLLKAGRLDDAVYAFGEAIATAPELSKSRFNLAFTYQKQRKYGEAKRAYRRVLDIEDMVNARLMLGVLLEKEGNDQEALIQFGKVLDKEPGNESAIKYKVKIETRMAEATKVVQAPPVAATDKEMESRIHNKAGVDSYSEGRYSEAFNEFVEAIMIDSENLQARFNLGVAYQRHERYGEAIIEFQKILEIKDLPRAHIMLGAVYAMQGRDADASEELTKVAFFGFDSWRLSKEGARTIGQLAKLAKLTGDTPSNDPLRLDGHTDSTGPDKYNLRLSKNRAIAVAMEMIASNGVEPDSIFISGRGEAKPIATNRKRRGRKLNRRVEMILAGKGDIN
jgi:outer membrane protein OmpA-like peptidoglycan-associated protein